ncbi:NAD(P)-dependent oxidoreductase [Fodinicurvata fenggangensis]|uniref:NAD(P)-dependent oxidoreductase n=1 Tax=Fodinicurvata fenggangensis TaxID=1121830 RepID=UPI00047D42AE|nr:NAD(P)-dependent oxidoreductase [Fodinicurvata fenggangensis]
MSQNAIGFIGLGRMGGPMSTRLLKAGYQVVVHDVSQQAIDRLVGEGAESAGSPREVAERSDIVLTSLPTPPIVEETALGKDGIVKGERAQILIDVSTTGPSTATRVAEGLATAGKQWVDSPVSGGVAGATNGTLAVMVSCPQATFERVEPLVQNFGKIFHVGDKPGLAQVLKLANNMLAAGALVLSSEALAMGVKAGIDPKVMIDTINVSSGRNSATQDKFPKAILPGTFDFGFATGLSYKDVRMCIDESETLGVPMLGGAFVREMLAITQAKYGADSDFTCIARLMEEWADVEIRG